MGLNLCAIIVLGAFVLSACVEGANEGDLLMKNAFVSEAGSLRLDNSVLSSYAEALYPSPLSNSSLAQTSFFSTFFTISVNSSFSHSALSFVLTPDPDLPAVFPNISTSPPSLRLHTAAGHSGFAFILNFNISESTPGDATIIGIGGVYDYPEFMAADIFVSRSWILLNESTLEFFISIIYDAAASHSLSLGVMANNNTLKLSPTSLLQRLPWIPSIGVTSTAQNVSDFSSLLSNLSHVGLVATGGGVFDIPQWNLTIHDSFIQVVQQQAAANQTAVNQTAVNQTVVNQTPVNPSTAPTPSTSRSASLLSASSVWLALCIAATMDVLIR